MRAWSHRAQFLPGRPVEAWLYRVAINLICDYHRRGRRRKTSSLDTLTGIGAEDAGVDALEIEDHRYNPGACLMTATVSESLQLAVRALPDAYRQCLLLYYQERPYKTISRMLDCPLGTVRSRVHRARRIVRQALEDGAGQETGPSKCDRTRLADRRSLPAVA